MMKTALMEAAIISVAFILISSTAAYAEPAWGGMTFLLIRTSPRAAAMGECSANLIDEQSGMYNPGAMGLFHLRKAVGIYAPLKTNYLPDLADDFDLDTFGGSVGMAFDLFGTENDLHKFSVALGYSRMRLDLGNRILTDEFGNIILAGNSLEKSDNFSIGMGIDYLLRLGIGYTLKLAKIDFLEYDSKATAYDVGAIVEFPVSDWLYGETETAKLSNWDYRMSFTPSIAYVNANNGTEKISGSFGDQPLSHAGRLGFLFPVSLNKGTRPIISASLAWEREKDLTSISANNTIVHSGFEFAAGQALFVRIGQIDDPHNFETSTMGVGLNIGRTIDWFIPNVLNIEMGDPNHRVFGRLEISLDYARYYGDRSAKLNTELINLRIAY